MLEQDALAPAAAPDNDHRFAFLNAKVHVVQDLVLTEALRQSADLDHKVLKICPSASVRKKFEMRMVMDE